MTTTSLWVKNEAQKLISNCEDIKIVGFTLKVRLDPVESGKARLLFVGVRLRNQKHLNGGQIGWWAIWKAYHIRKVSWHQGFKFFMGNYVKRAWEMSGLEKAEQKEELCVKYFELIWARDFGGMRDIKSKVNFTNSNRLSNTRNNMEVAICKDVNLELQALI